MSLSLRDNWQENLCRTTSVMDSLQKVSYINSFLINNELMVILCSIMGLSLFLITLCVGASFDTKDQRTLKMDIKLNKREYLLGEPIELDIALTNMGQGPVKLHKRFYVTVNLKVLITDQKGKVLPYIGRCVYPPTTVLEGDIITLQPTESKLSRYNLDEMYPLDKPGTYRVKTIYRWQENWNKLYLKDSDLILEKPDLLWVGEIESNTLVLKIKPHVLIGLLKNPSLCKSVIKNKFGLLFLFLDLILLIGLPWFAVYLSKALIVKIGGKPTKGKPTKEVISK